MEFDRGLSGKAAIAADQYSRERDYWLKKFSGDWQKTFFPYDQLKSKSNRVKRKSVEFQFTTPCASKLMELSKGLDHRLYIILVAGLAALLYKYTGSNDIIIGSPIFKQETEGDFINIVLALRNQLHGNMTFRELLLDRVKPTITEASEYQNYPFESLLQQLDMPFNQEEFPLFDVVLLLENIHEKKYVLHTNPNIIFSFLRTGETVGGIVEYNFLRYYEETVERIACHFKRLLEEVVLNLNIKIYQIDILGEQEKKQILYDFSVGNGEIGSPAHQTKTIHQLFEEQVNKKPDNIAVIGKAYSVTPMKDVQLTYRQLNKSSNQLTRILIEKGVITDAIVSIMAESSVEMLIGILGILKAGGAFLPIDPRVPQDRVLTMLAESGASVLLSKTSITANYSLTALQGLQRLGKDIQLTPRRTQVKDIDALGIPDRSLVDYEKYSKYIGLTMFKNTIVLQATRGCPFQCAYCHKLWPKTHVVRSARHIFAEVKLYYNMGVKRFAFIDDIFNLDVENSSRFFRLIIREGLNVQLFFPNGFRGDLLTKEYIDLAVKAGTVNIALSLETASPRLQKLVKKNMNLAKLKDNIQYICDKYPHIILELQVMHGFPSETEEEAMMTMDFVKSLKWVHFPYLHILKIYPNTDMAALALEKGISYKAIENSANLAYHELPETLPFDKRFTLKYQGEFLNDYFLSKERLLHLLPYQLKIMTEDELVRKYDSYLPVDINTLGDLYRFAGIDQYQLDIHGLLNNDNMSVPGLNQKIREHFPAQKPSKGALRVLLLDLSQFFSNERKMLYDVVEAPLGLMYLLTDLNRRFGNKVDGKIAKSRVDFDCYGQLRTLLDTFKPDVIGVRTLTFYRDFFHKTVLLIRQWGIDVPIIAGGPYATSDYNILLQDKNIDLVVLGEGEVTFSQLIGNIIENNGKLPGEKILSGIPGIAFISNRNKTPNRFGREIIMLNEAGDIFTREYTCNFEINNRAGDLSYVIFTSGSTGKPKGVMVEHRALENLCCWHNRNYEVDQRDHATKYAGFGFDASVWEIFPYLIKGAPIYIIPDTIKLDMEQLNRYFEKKDITIAFLPTQVYEQFSKLENRSLRLLLTGGDKLKIFNKQEYRLYNNYGPTENTVVATFYPVNNEPDNIPIGQPIDNSMIYIIDRDNRYIQPVGVPGELCICGGSLARGYLNDPELTSIRFVLDDNPDVKGKRMYKTGDSARWLTDGNIEFLGRIDQQVKIRGNRIELAEIEHCLIKHKDIKDVVAVMRGTDKRKAHGDKPEDKYICAYFVSDKNPGISDLKDFLLQMLPLYMVPSYLMKVEKIPLTANGKVDRKALPKPKVVDSISACVMAQTPVEEKLTEIWSEVLGIEKEYIGIDTDFFRIGGHSLNAITLISRLHKAFDVRITLSDLFKTSTIRELAEYTNKLKRERFGSIQIAEKKEYYKLSPAQKRLYMLQQMELESIAYNVPQAYEIEGELDAEELKTTIRKLIHRHESFRTSFHMMEEEPVQKVHDNIEFALEYYDIPGPADHHSPYSTKNLLNVFIRTFELSKSPLLRVGLITHPQPPVALYTSSTPLPTYQRENVESKYILMIDMHHIVMDGTSMELFIKEFTALYAGEQLPSLKFQYKDYSQWQNSDSQKKALEDQERWWFRQFADEVPVLDMPLDYPRPEIQHFVGEILFWELSIESTAALKHMALDTGTTLYMVLLAIYNILLSKLSGQEDIVVGTPSAARRHADLERIIGMFVNTLALRHYPNGEKTVLEFLAEVKKNTLQVFENQEYQFEDLVELVSVNRDISRNPIFDTLFVLQNMEPQANDIPMVDSFQLKIRPYEIEHRTAKFDLILTCYENEEKLFCFFEYCTKIFKKQTIERFIIYYKQILSAVLEDSNKRISQIEIITANEKQQILYDFNNTISEYPKDKTLHQLFEEQAGRTPGRVVLIGQIPNKEKSFGQILNTFGEGHLSYQELNEKSHQLAWLLIEKGVNPDTIVGFMVERSLEMIIGILGILKAGGAYLPIDPDYPQERISYILADSSAKFLVMTPDLSKKIEKLSINNCQLLMVHEKPLACQRHNTPPKANSVNNNQLKLTINNLQLEYASLAYIIYTSGSTGRPKGILVEHYSVVNLVCSQIKRFRINDSDRILQFSPIYFDASIEQIFIALSSGAVLVLISKEAIMDHERFEKYISTQLITHIHAVPSFLNNMKIKPSSSLKRIISGGDICPVALAQKWSQTCDFYNEYGPTETTVTSIEMQMEPVDETFSVLPIGKPISNTIVYVLDKLMQPVPLNIAGELVIGGEGVARGYLNNPGLTTGKFIRAGNRHWSLAISPSKKLSKSTNDSSPSPHLPYSTHSTIYRTGDLARWLSDGKIELLGRIDLQVKIRGFRIELGEIESQLLNHPGIKEAVVITRTTQKQDNYLCAYINSDKKMTASELRAYLSKGLPDYMVPSNFVFLESIPLTPNGKVDRNALPDPEWKARDEFHAPRNEMEKRLVEMWSKVLEIPEDIIGIENNFFELGGHSLKATIFITKVQRELNIRLPLTEVFKTPTIRQLAEYVRNEIKEDLSSPDEYLVLLKMNSSKVKHFFFIHDGTGEVDGYIELCNRLNIGFNYWGIRVGTNRLESLAPRDSTIEELAQTYIEKIKKIQPYGQGPYYILGWSLGGTIAFEIVLQLEKMGEKVSFLGLVDSPGPQPNLRKEISEFKVESELDWLWHYLPDTQIKEKVINVSDKNEIWSIIVNHFEENNLHVEIIKRVIPDHLVQLLPNYHQLGIRELIYYLNLNRTLTHARTFYIPSEKIRTTLQYFKAHQSSQEFQASWNDYCINIKSVEIPGEHLSIFKPPDVEQTAKIIENAILNNSITT
jgi:amino acid adenylation domain-containing protein